MGERISFRGVVAFIYGDLLVVPLILIYVNITAAGAAGWIVALFYLTMVISGVVVDLFLAVSASCPPARVRRARSSTR